MAAARVAGAAEQRRDGFRHGDGRGASPRVRQAHPRVLPLQAREDLRAGASRASPPVSNFPEEIRGPRDGDDEAREAGVRGELTRGAYGGETAKVRVWTSRAIHVTVGPRASVLEDVPDEVEGGEGAVARHELGEGGRVHRVAARLTVGGRARSW